jgi:hypothetical protein
VFTSSFVFFAPTLGHIDKSIPILVQQRYAPFKVLQAKLLPQRQFGSCLA